MNDELTILQGCFNCAKYSQCMLGKARKNELKDILVNHETGEQYRYGCCCGRHEPIKNDVIQVEFT